MKSILRYSLFLLIIFLLIGCDSTPIDDDNDEPTIDQTTFVVTFETNGGSSIPSQTIEKGDTITYPDNPIKEGFIFIGWFTTSSFDQAFDRMSEINKDMTLYASWQKISINDVTITFETEYGNVVSPIIGEPGTNISIPNDLTDTFYDFVEWRIKGTTTVFTNTVIPDESIILEAVWEKNDTYEVTFYIDNNEYDSFLFTAGSTLTLPSNPEVENYIFLGWYEQNTFVSEYNNLEALPSAHLELYGKLVLIDDYFYEATFDTVGGNDIEPVLQIVGNRILEPNTPIKKGYIFEGWYEEANYQNPYNFNQTHTEDITLYAKWTFDDTYTITNLIASETETKQIILGQGENVDLPQLFREGYIFDWWYTTENYNVRYRDYLYFAEPLGYELNLYAKWIEAPNVVYLTLETYGGTKPRYSITEGVMQTGIIQANPDDEIWVINPSKEGYNFAGWYEDEAFSTIVMPASSSTSSQKLKIPSADTTYYAKWVSKTTGQVDEGSTEIESTILERLIEYGFTCINNSCVLEEYTNYNYIFDLDTLDFSYVIDVDTITEDGYRYYDRVITINSDYDITYSYHALEDFGYLYNVDIEIEGNYLTNTYQVLLFDSNVTQQQTNYDKAMDFIENIVMFYEAILNNN
jgi:uncharacterized repeat protein (TIGR02543 family)